VSIENCNMVSSRALISLLINDGEPIKQVDMIEGYLLLYDLCVPYPSNVYAYISPVHHGTSKQCCSAPDGQ
jgi:hypothetical protein